MSCHGSMEVEECSLKREACEEVKHPKETYIVGYHFTKLVRTISYFKQHHASAINDSYHKENSTETEAITI